ncbi:PxKF domain-containing protein [Lysobacter sp. CFH 32150]|uniref:PxKF domain-containing protein n=1 Tax=Lysobacter sp. CFH 32150 TaxID=2927128 RepID=UPI001FA7339A|nr:PxKF domain-containing protein [Lysobacter sp. CFH 32150]MCI4567896.1 PxKF domain-containing protein [Lysobacter sp. CFH 32150]
MSSRFSRAVRGMSVVCLVLIAVLLALPAAAQVRQEGAVPDGRGGVVVLAAGDFHTCALRSNGTVACWGKNDHGEATPPPGHFIALTAGRDHSCGLRDDGRPVCWGSNADGQSTVPEWGEFTAIAAGGKRTCGLRTWGQVECWGQGPQIPWQLPRLVALDVGPTTTCGLQADGSVVCWDLNGEIFYTPQSGPFTALATGNDGTACGLRADGEVACVAGWANWFGNNVIAISVGGGQCWLENNGALRCMSGGLGAPLAPAGSFTAVSDGEAHACALRSDGHLQCWGNNDFGQATPPEGVFGLGSIDAGMAHNCHVRADGTVACWGENNQGQTDAPNGSWDRFTEIGAGDAYSCARRDNGDTLCWGTNEHGEHNGSGLNLRQLGLGRMHGCALEVSGEIRCWGWNENGQTTPPGFEPYRGVSAGFAHSCAVQADGNGVCWGYNGNGQTDVPNPPPYADAGVRYLAIAAGDWSSCALTSDNFVRCWGDQGPSAQYPPTGYFRALSMAGSYGCAIRTDGRLACWGNHVINEAQPPTGRYVSVTSGNDHSCAIRSDGARVCWGDDSRGQYPHLELEPRDVPPLHLNQAIQVWLALYTWVSNDSYHQTPGTFSVISGALPPGLALGTDGQLSGTPIAAGVYPVTIEGRNENGFVAQNDFVFRIDGTPPSITANVTGTRGQDDWYTSDVEITWLLDEPESWITFTAGCEPSVLTNDSPNAGFICTAQSDGGSATETVNVKRDATAPETSVTSGPDAYTNQTTAAFVVAGSDATSGLEGFECALDGAAYQACAANVAFAGLVDGPHTLSVRARDVAGNRDASPVLYSWRIDTSPPTVTPTISGTLGNNGWYVSNVQVSWDVSDSGSPLSSTTGCNTVTLSSDTLAASFTCTATSAAGGTTSKTVTVKRDATAPTVVAAAMTAPNAAGWYKSDVDVGFSCSDGTAGIVACPAAQVLSGEGTALTSATRSVTDAAGNSATSNVVTVKIDRTAPTLAPSVAATLLLNSTAQASANGSDALSGIATQQCAPLATGSIGSKSVTCTVTDAAGNSANASANYRVAYGFVGFSSPVANPPTLNVFKAGRSAPFRWRVVDAQGAPVNNLTAASVGATAIACPSATENRISVYGGGNSQLQNLGNGYYQLDWSAPSGYRNTCKRVNLDLGDGEAHPAQFKFN